MLASIAVGLKSVRHTANCHCRDEEQINLATNSLLDNGVDWRRLISCESQGVVLARIRSRVLHSGATIMRLLNFYVLPHSEVNIL